MGGAHVRAEDQSNERRGLRLNFHGDPSPPPTPTPVCWLRPSLLSPPHKQRQHLSQIMPRVSEANVLGMYMVTCSV